MKCKGLEKKISDYLNKALDRKERLQLEEHLKYCERCRNILNALEKTDDLARECLEVKPTAGYLADYWPRLRSKIKSESKKSRPSFFHLRPGWKPAVALTAVALLIIAGAVLLGRVTYLQSQLNESRQETKELLMKLAQADKPGKSHHISGNIILTGGIQKDIYLFRELQKSFSYSIEWVAIDGERIDLGLSDVKYTELADVSQPLVFLDFIILKEDAESHAEPVSSPRLIVRNDREVNATFRTGPEFGITHKIRSRPRIIGENKVALEVDLVFQKTIPKNAGKSPTSQLFTSVNIEPGKSVELGSMPIDNDLYRVEVLAIAEESVSPPSPKKVL